MKRGRANGRYGRWRRAITQTFNQLVDEHESKADEERRRLLDALATLETTLHCAGDVYSYDAQGNRTLLNLAAGEAIKTLRSMVESVEIVFE